MQNENWYVITMLIVNILTAIGTVGVVIVSVWFAWKAQHREKSLLHLMKISHLIHEQDKIHYLTISFRFDNFCDKDIIIDRVLCDFMCGYGIFDDEKKIIPAFGRNSYISIKDSFDSREMLMKSISLLKNTSKIKLYIDSNIGTFDIKITKNQIKRFKTELKLA